MFCKERNSPPSNASNHYYKMRSSLALLLFLVFSQGYGQSNLNLSKGLALSGYDPVSYFTSDLPSKGEPSIQCEYNGATYQFTSEEHRKAFTSSPEMYLPEYGGWCAYAMGKDGSKVKINPLSYKILNGKLYLFYKTSKLDTLKLWNENETTLLEKANHYWQNINHYKK